MWDENLERTLHDLEKINNSSSPRNVTMHHSYSERNSLLRSFTNISYDFADHMDSFWQVKAEQTEEGKCLTTVSNVVTCLPYDHNFGSESHEKIIKELRDRHFFVHYERVPRVNTLFIVVADSMDFDLASFKEFLKSNKQFRKHRAYYLKGLFVDPSSRVVHT